MNSLGLDYTDLQKDILAKQQDILQTFREEVLALKEREELQKEAIGNSFDSASAHLANAGVADQKDIREAYNKDLEQGKMHSKIVGLLVNETFPLNEMLMKSRDSMFAEKADSAKLDTLKQELSTNLFDHFTKELGMKFSQEEENALRIILQDMAEKLKAIIETTTETDVSKISGISNLIIQAQNEAKENRNSFWSF